MTSTSSIEHELAAGNHGYNYAAILLDDGSEVMITDAMLEASLNDPELHELSHFMPDLSRIPALQ